MNPLTWLLTKGKRKHYLDEVNASLAARHAGPRPRGLTQIGSDVAIVNDKEDMWRIVPREQADDYIRSVRDQEQRTAKL